MLHLLQKLNFSLHWFSSLRLKQFWFLINFNRYFFFSSFMHPNSYHSISPSTYHFSNSIIINRRLLTKPIFLLRLLCICFQQLLCLHVSRRQLLLFLLLVRKHLQESIVLKLLVFFILSCLITGCSHNLSLFWGLQHLYISRGILWSSTRGV